MKFLVKSFFIFLFIFLGLKYLFFMFDDGHVVNYNIGNFNIKEVYTSFNDSYFFNLKSDDYNTNFQINYKNNKKEKILKSIIYKKIDGYNCLYPIFKDSNLSMDIMCLKDKEIYYGNALNNENINNEFRKNGYNSSKYIDNSKKIDISNTQSMYKDNILDNTYIAVETYKGLKLFNGKETEVKLFENDVYKKPISTFADKYYLVADYNSQYTFKNIFVVNIVNGEKKSIRSYDDLSFDSYIMGSVDGKTYLFDKETNFQYEIDLNQETINKVGNKNNIKYYNGKWGVMSLMDARNEKKFSTSKVESDFEKVDLVGNYYYFYKRENDALNVYRSDKQNKNLKTYLFETTDMDNIIYLNNKVYYKNKNTFNVFSDYSSKKLISYSELEFNNDIWFGVYEK